MKHIISQFPFIKWLRLFLFNVKWRLKNNNNFTTVNNKFLISKVTVGEKTYGSLNVISYNNSEEKLKIGKYCSISSNVTFILSGEHNYKKISTYPFNNIFFHKIECTCKGPIIIEDDVWIGYGAVVLSGVHIGKGAVIGAGSIVSKDIPPYAIFANGKILKYRFSKNIIKKLIDFDLNINDNLNSIINDLNTEITEDNVENIINNLTKK